MYSVGLLDRARLLAMRIDCASLNVLTIMHTIMPKQNGGVQVVWSGEDAGHH